MMRKMKPSELKPHPLNEQIYGDEPVDEELMESIKEHGVLEILKVKQDGTIISGHRRWKACMALGPEVVKKVSCEIVGFGDVLDEELHLIEYNRQRKKTNAQLAAEGLRLEEIYGKQAEERMKAGKKQDNEGHDQADPRPNLAQGTVNESTGKTIEKVADELGLGKESYRKLKKVREAQESEDPLESSIAKENLNDPKKSIHRSSEDLKDYKKLKEASEDLNPVIAKEAKSLIQQIRNKKITVKEAWNTVLNTIKEQKAKEKALQDTYPSDDYEGTGEYIDSDEVIESPEKANAFLNTLPGAKPADDSPKFIFDKKPAVSPKYQIILDATKDANLETATYAEILIKAVNNDTISTDDAIERLENKISEIEARESMKDIPEEPGEKLENDVPEKASRENIPTPNYEGIPEEEAVRRHASTCDFDCGSCNIQPQFCFKKSDIYKLKYEGAKLCTSCMDKLDLETFPRDLKILVQDSLESVKGKREWSMEDHMRLNKVLMLLQSSSS